MLTGVDIGSRTTKAVIINDGDILVHHILDTGTKLLKLSPIGSKS